MRKTSSFLVTAGLLAHALLVPISIAGMQIALGVAAVGLLLAAVGGARPVRTPLDWPLLAFVAVAIASDVLSSYGAPTLSFATLWRAALGFWIVAQGLRLARPGTAVHMLAHVALGLGLASILGLVQYRTGIDPVHLLHLRAAPQWVEAPGVPGRFGAMGFFTSRLSFGHNAAVLLALLSGALAADALPRKLRAPVAIAVLLGLAAVAATFDRGAWLGLCAAAALLALLSPARRSIVLVLAMAAVLASLAPGVRARFVSAFDARANGDRVFLWARAGEIIRDHPVAGIGFANYPRVCGAYYDRVDPTFFMRTWAHNSELSLLAETGPLGVLAFLWVVGAAARALWRRRGEPFATGALAAGAALLVIAQVHDVFYDTKVMYALWLALALGLYGTQAPPRGSPTATGA